MVTFISTGLELDKRIPPPAYSAILFDITENGFNGIINGPEWSGDLNIIPNWLDIQSESSWLESGEVEPIVFRINTVELIVDTNYQGKLIITSNADNIPIEISINLSIVNGGQIGDINLDGNIDVLDIVSVVNIILFGEYNDLADLNTDGVVNVLDVIQLVNLILNN